MIGAQRPSSRLTVATVNTHWGSLLHAADGLDPVADADIVLLQEVIDPDNDCREDLLEAAGFTLVYAAGRFGLAILARTATQFQMVPGSLREHLLQKMDAVEIRLMQRWAGRPHGFTEHGMISARFTTPDKKVVTVANVHPSMPVKPVARSIQVSLMAGLLTGSDYAGPLVVAGDMNHYRRPGLVDEAMRKSASLVRVDLGEEVTWQARGTGQEILLGALARLQKRPTTDFDGQLDAVLYRGDGLELSSAAVVDVKSDHRAVITTFSLSPGDAPVPAGGHRGAVVNPVGGDHEAAP